ncbi:hypothetical protein [Parapontixanthobacter aurantiacus]|uniref:hypothetical protein n=1 Tax=Parapontixanthobacter aurantiacus TaxID=1463599 RepID=UPI00301CB6F9
MLTLTNDNRSLVQRLAVIAALILQIGATTLPSMGYGEPIGSRSEGVDTLITPAGWAFSIWGPLYVGSALFAVWQAWPTQVKNPLLDRIGWPAAGVFAGNGVWALYTQLNDLTGISVLIITFSLVCSLVVLRAFVETPRPFTFKEKWLAALPLCALSGWLTAATIVNASAALKYHGLVLSSQEGANMTAIVLVGGALLVALALLRSRGMPWYALAFLWALTGIYFAGGQQFEIIAVATMIAAVLVLIGMAAPLKRSEHRRHWFGDAPINEVPV